jgi:hypothetical protein
MNTWPRAHLEETTARKQARCGVNFSVILVNMSKIAHLENEMMYKSILTAIAIFVVTGTAQARLNPCLVKMYECMQGCGTNGECIQWCQWLMHCGYVARKSGGSTQWIKRPHHKIGHNP